MTNSKPPRAISPSKSKPPAEKLAANPALGGANLNSSAPSNDAEISSLVPGPSSSQHVQRLNDPDALSEADAPANLRLGKPSEPPISQHSGMKSSQPHFS